MRLTSHIRHGEVSFAAVGTNIPSALQAITVEPTMDVNKTIASEYMLFYGRSIHVLNFNALQFSETFQMDHSVSTNQSHSPQSTLMAHCRLLMRKLTAVLS